MDHDEIYSKICEPKLNSMHADIKSVVNCLRGHNGNIGLVARVKTLETERKREASERKWLQRAVAGAVIAFSVPGGILFVIQLVQHLTTP